MQPAIDEEAKTESTGVKFPMPQITDLSVYAKEGDRWQLGARFLTPILVPPQR